jgi:hypothetical protein
MNRFGMARVVLALGLGASALAAGDAMARTNEILIPVGQP